MNKDSVIAALNDAASDAIELANAVQDGLLTRIRDGMVGHPRSPSFDAGQSTASVPEDLPDELRGRAPHSDPTGVAAVQAADHGDRARSDVIEIQRQIVVARKAVRRAVIIASRYNPRASNAADRALVAKENRTPDRGCESCSRIPTRDDTGKPKTQRTQWWNEVHLTTLIADKPVDLCRFCWETPRVGVRYTGVLPPIEDVIAYRDFGRARRRSA